MKGTNEPFFCVPEYLLTTAINPRKAAACIRLVYRSLTCRTVGFAGQSGSVRGPSAINPMSFVSLFFIQFLYILYCLIFQDFGTKSFKNLRFNTFIESGKQLLFNVCP